MAYGHYGQNMGFMYVYGFGGQKLTSWLRRNLKRTLWDQFMTVIRFQLMPISLLLYNSLKFRMGGRRPNMHENLILFDFLLIQICRYPHAHRQHYLRKTWFLGTPYCSPYCTSVVHRLHGLCPARHNMIQLPKHKLWYIKNWNFILSTTSKLAPLKLKIIVCLLSA